MWWIYSKDKQVLFSTNTFWRIFSPMWIWLSILPLGIENFAIFGLCVLKLNSLWIMIVKSKPKIEHAKHEMQIASNTCMYENLTWYVLYIFRGIPYECKPVREISSVYKVFLLASRASHGFEGHYKLVSISFKSLFMFWHYARTRGVSLGWA